MPFCDRDLYFQTQGNSNTHKNAATTEILLHSSNSFSLQYTSLFSRPRHTINKTNAHLHKPSSILKPVMQKYKRTSYKNPPSRVLFMNTFQAIRVHHGVCQIPQMTKVLQLIHTNQPALSSKSLVLVYPQLPHKNLHTWVRRQGLLRLDTNLHSHNTTLQNPFP